MQKGGEPLPVRRRGDEGGEGEEAEQAFDPATSETTKGITSLDFLSPQLQMTMREPTASHSPPRHLVFPDVQVLEAATRRCSDAMPPLPPTSAEMERRATEADIDAAEALQRQKAAARLEEEEKIKREADKRVEEDQREEKELLRRAEEVRKRRENLAREAEERLERVKREERERLKDLQAQNQAIKSDLQRERISPALTLRSMRGDGGEIRDKISGPYNRSPGGDDFNLPRLPQPPSPRHSANLCSSPLLEKSILGAEETKPDVNHLLSVVKAQSEMVRQLAASHLQLQKEMKEMMKSTSQSRNSVAASSPTSVQPATPRPPSVDTLLAHSRLADTRPCSEDRWKGGRDVKTFLKRFKTLVEDLPGITPDLVWNEFSFRTTGLALHLLDPFKDEEAEVAIRKAKERYLRIWARTPRDVREILEEAMKGNQVKGTDFDALIGLVAELEDYRRQATLNDDQDKFDEAESLMAIVAARLACFEIKWSKYALKKRVKRETVNFRTLITFIEDEASALEEPEGVKARARAHEFVSQLQKQASNKGSMEKDKWGGKGSKVDPLIVNTAQVAQNPVPSSSHVGGQQVQFQPSVTPFSPNKTTTAPYAASTSSALSSCAPPLRLLLVHSSLIEGGKDDLVRLVEVLTRFLLAISSWIWNQRLEDRSPLDTESASSVRTALPTVGGSARSNTSSASGVNRPTIILPFMWTRTIPPNRLRMLVSPGAPS